jgi:WD40 repeat protein/energy-coupling factor transporter ATP-binding protein EcfA2
MFLKRFGQHLAVVIGINDYHSGVPVLQTPVNDAQALAALLGEQHGYEVTLRLNGQANRAALEELLEQDLPKRLGENDRLLFYFAGHGIALNGDEGPEGYLVPQDARLNELDTYLRMAWVHQALLQLPCRHFLGILDCCFAGAFRWSSTRKLVAFDQKVIHRELFDRFILDPAWQMITSAGSNQEAFDLLALKSSNRGLRGEHSPFAAALLAALEGGADAFPVAAVGKPPGDGGITASELYLYLRDQVEPDTAARNLRQTPGLFPRKKHDKGEYIFLVPGHPLNLPPAPALDVSSNPYRGLAAFDEAHKDLFWGRQALTQALMKFVKGHALTVVLGASGSGKSSLVKAGLVPVLRQTPGWNLLPAFRPGESPFKALNAALDAVELAPVALSVSGNALGLLTSTQSLDFWFREHPKAHLLVVIDQFEELMTLCRDQQERDKFLQALAEGIARYPEQLHVVLTLRSDFEAQFQNAALLKDQWQAARFIVPAMSRDELRQAVEEPASARVMYFEPHQLVEQLIDEVANMPGALPLLSFALSELYLNYLKRQEEAKLQGETIDRAMTQEDYEQIGGVTRSLTQRAEQEYDALVQQDPAYQQTIRNVMLRMVSVRGELARRRVLLSELVYPEPENIRVKKVIQQFTDARLLTAGKDNEEQDYQEPAHDALVRGWDRLLRWRQNSLADLLLQRELNPRAERWQKEKRKKQSLGLLWNNDPRLPQLRQLLESGSSWLNTVEIEFVKRSLQRKKNNLRRLLAFLVAVIVALSGAAIYASGQAIHAQNQTKIAEEQRAKAEAEQQRAENETKRANEERQRAAGQTTLAEEQRAKALKQTEFANQQRQLAREKTRIALNEKNRAEKETQRAIQEKKRAIEQTTIAQLREQSARVLSLLPTNDVVLGLILAIENMKQSQQVPELARQAHINLLLALQATPEANRLQGHRVESVAISSNGKQIASGGADGTIQLWNAFTGKPIGIPIQGHQGSVLSIAFSHDDQRIVSGGSDFQIRVWNAHTGKPIGERMSEHTMEVTSAIFSRDNKYIISAGNDGQIFLWNVQTGKKIRAWSGGLWRQFTSIALSHDGQRIATGTKLGTLELWNIQENRSLKLIEQLMKDSGASVTSISFSPDDKSIVSSQVNMVQLWHVQTGKFIGLPLRGHSGIVTSVAFSPNGKLIVGGSTDNTVKLWNSQTRNLVGLPLRGHSAAVTSVAISPDGKRIVSGGQDNTVRLWNINADQFLKYVFHSRGDSINSLVFSRDGKRLISAGRGDIIELWDTQTGKLIANARKAQNSNITSLAISPDDYYLVSGSTDGKLQLWDAQTLKSIGLSIQGHEGPVFTVTSKWCRKVIFKQIKRMSLCQSQSGSGVCLLF